MKRRPGREGSGNHVADAQALQHADTRTKDAFAPIDPANVRMYVCGRRSMTTLISAMRRPVIVFDVLFRLLRHLYGADHVHYVRNITDVDDKINARAAERGDAIRELTDETTDESFRRISTALGCLPPTVEPRATEHIAQMIAMIERLIAPATPMRPRAMCCSTCRRCRTTARCRGRSLDEMLAGARVEVAPYKRDAMDFVLWKPSKDDEPGWDSPWGRGRVRAGISNAPR